MPAAILACPRCQKSVTIDTLLGSQVSCPFCGERIAMPFAAPAEEWFFARNKQKYGPWTWAQLQQYAADGQLKRDDMVMKQGTPKWAPAGSVEGLWPAAVPTAITAVPRPAPPPMSWPGPACAAP